MPTANERSNHIPQEVTDISSADELLRFAAAGQLDSLTRRFAQGGIALGGGLGATKANANATLARELRNGLSSKHLQGLDMIIGALRRAPMAWMASAACVAGAAIVAETTR